MTEPADAPGPAAIRLARPEDAAVLAALCGQLGYPTAAAELEPRLGYILARADHAIFVAEVGGKVVGWTHAFVYQVLESDRVVELGGLVVDERQRGQGVGRRLVQAVEGWAVTHGLVAVCLRSNTIRTAAHHFYQGLGYRRLKSQHAFRKELSPPTPKAPAGSTSPAPDPES